MAVPLPPLPEQLRIVKKVNSLLKKIDALADESEKADHLREKLRTALLRQLDRANSKTELQTAWNALSEQFETVFDSPKAIKELRKSILQLAVKGKLVPQDPSDEPASVLLKKIKAEKERLIKEKKIKKQKPLPAIEAGEIPFEVPEGWIWCRLGNAGEFINGDRGKNYPNKSEYVNSGIPWINTGHIDPNGTLSSMRMNFITKEKFETLRSGKITLGDLVYCFRGATFGKTAIVDPFAKGAIASSLMIIRLAKDIDRKFAYYFLTSPLGRQQLKRFDNGSAQPNLSANKVKLYLFPLPPLPEQKRIVQKVSQLMRWCDDLEAALEKRVAEKARLLQRVLRSAV